MSIRRLVVETAAFGLAATWSYFWLSIANISMGIGGSGLSDSILEMLGFLFFGCAITNGVMVVMRIRYRWVAAAVLLQLVFAAILAGRFPDYYTVYFTALLFGGLFLLTLIARRFH